MNLWRIPNTHNVRHSPLDCSAAYVDLSETYHVEGWVPIQLAILTFLPGLPASNQPTINLVCACFHGK